MVAVANARPDLLAKALVANDEGSYSVTFHSRPVRGLPTVPWGEKEPSGRLRRDDGIFLLPVADFMKGNSSVETMALGAARQAPRKRGKRIVARCGEYR